MIFKKWNFALGTNGTFRSISVNGRECFKFKNIKKERYFNTISRFDVFISLKCNLQRQLVCFLHTFHSTYRTIPVTMLPRSLLEIRVTITESSQRIFPGVSAGAIYIKNEHLLNHKTLKMLFLNFSSGCMFITRVYVNSLNFTS